MPEVDTHTGQAATCQRVTLSELSPRAAATVANWLVTSDQFHPLWRQWSLYGVHLREQAGVATPNLEFMGATHEIGILALNPDTPVTVEEMAKPDWGPDPEDGEVTTSDREG